MERHQQGHKAIWKAGSLRSAFGTQCLATMRSSPACGFGSSLREAGLKVHASGLRAQHLIWCEVADNNLLLLPVRQTYISPDADRALCRAQGGNNSQGPASYRVPVWAA